MAPTKPPRTGNEHGNGRKSDSPEVRFVQSLPITHMPRLHPQRASPSRSVKRQRASETGSTSSRRQPLIFSRSTKQTRDRLFDALESETESPVLARLMENADHLDDAQLIKCFEILHACGKATDPNATMAVTRQSVDGFLEAIFHGWTSESEGEPARPELEFVIDAKVVAGRVCVTPDCHADLASCVASSICKVDISAVATYICDPAMLKIEFSMIDPFTGQPEIFCAVGRNDIHWVVTDWVQELKKALEGKAVSRIHKHNKHLAIWQARRLIQAWSKGHMSTSADVGKMGFLGREAAVVATAGLGLVVG